MFFFLNEIVLGECVFLGDDLQSIGYANWGLNEPNNLGGNEHCGSMHFTGTLNDLDCDVPAVFICEINSNNWKSGLTSSGNIKDIGTSTR